MFDQHPAVLVSIFVDIKITVNPVIKIPNAMCSEFFRTTQQYLFEIYYVTVSEQNKSTVCVNS